MSYTVKEIFYTLQGEGFHSGTPAVFCRFARCNLWTGREDQRASAICQFCDTDFVGIDGPGGGRFADANELATTIASVWGHRDGPRFVVLTGGEPLLQVDQAFVEALHGRGFKVAIETNGTRIPPAGIDWICVSPKAGAELVLREGDEMKLVFPQPHLAPEDVEDLAFDHYFLQPMDGAEGDKNTALAVDHCLSNPTWKLSLQTHKYLGIP
jgi:7-carboxy-7-deazaguanine synthase (Cx14CxxC type)